MIKDVMIKDLKVGSCRMIISKKIIQKRGDIIIGELGQSIPFTPKRYFIVNNVPPEEVRGQHAHKVCHQILICIHGSIIAHIDDGYKKEEVILEDPSHGLYMPPMTWGAQSSFSKESKLLVLASHLYDKDEYINSYNEFRKALKIN